MADAGLIAGAATCAIGGLLALYLRLRQEHDRPIAILGVVLVAAATPLILTVVRGSVSDTLLFAWFAAATYWPKRAHDDPRKSATLMALVLLAPLVVPDTEPRPTLFAPHNGLLALTPVVYVAVIAAIIRLRHEALEVLPGLTALVLWPLTGTPLLPALAMLTTSLAAGLAWARRHPLIAATPLILTPIVWNYWLMVQYTAGTIPKDAPVSFATMVRQQADVHTRPPYAYPFAFPGNAISAWREGVPFWRYDMLAAEPRLEAFDVLFDRTGDRYLLDGWGALASNATGWFRPIVDDGATVLAPLQPAAREYEIAVMVQPRSEASLGMTIDIAINGSAIGRIVMDRPEPFESRLRVPATDVGRILRAGYNRVSIVPARPALVAVYRLRLTPIA